MVASVGGRIEIAQINTPCVLQNGCKVDDCRYGWAVLLMRVCSMALSREPGPSLSSILSQVRTSRVASERAYGEWLRRAGNKGHNAVAVVATGRAVYPASWIGVYSRKFLSLSS